MIENEQKNKNIIFKLEIHIQTWKKDQNVTKKNKELKCYMKLS
jgi:hypothetical protein